MRILRHAKWMTIGVSVVSSLLLAMVTVNNTHAVTLNQEWVSTAALDADTTVSRGSQVAYDNAGNVYTASDQRNTTSLLFSIGVRKYDSSGNVMWTRSYSATPRHAIVSDIITDSAGNVYVTGDVDGANTRYVTLKYDSDGNLLWTADFNNPGASGRPSGNGETSTIRVDSSGSIYVVGGASGGLLLVKYDTNGNQVWAKTSNNCSYNCGNVSISLDGTGDIYVSGNITGPNGIGLTKYDSDGNQLWNSTYGGAGNYPVNMTLDSSQNIYLLGTVGSLGSYETIKVNSFGSQVWARHFAASNIDHSPRVIKVDNTGNVYVTGFQSINGQRTLTIKYDSTGNQLWTSTYAYASQHEGISLDLDSQGSAYVGGRGFKTFQPVGYDYDYVLVKYDSNGGTTLAASLDLGGYEDFRDAVRDSAGNIYVTGSSCNYAHSDCKLTTVKYSTPAPGPTNLHANTPTKQPVLQWDVIPNADQYKVYRNGNLVATVTNNAYTDTTASDGTAIYYVTSLHGANESLHSNSINVLVDNTVPTITYSTSPAPNANGWNNSNVTVSFVCGDTGSGVDICQNAVLLTTEGSNLSTTGTAVDKAGNVATVTASNIKIDKTAPIISNLAMSTTLILFQANITIIANATDSLSGVTRGEYFIDNDPGQGNATTMAFSNGQLSATRLVQNIGFGQHTLYARSVDAAGNWSTLASRTFRYIGF